MILTRKSYDRSDAVSYVRKYGISKNPYFPYYEGNDCTNYVSQCIHAGGAEYHYHPTHPWWYQNGKTSICWSVAASLYWYIRVCSKEKRFGVKAKTITIEGDHTYSTEIANILQPGDIIQYMNTQNRIQHSAVITDFTVESGVKNPLISQHTFEAVNIPWKKGFKKTIFHHITDIN